MRFSTFTIAVAVVGLIAYTFRVSEKGTFLLKFISKPIFLFASADMFYVFYHQIVLV